MGIGVSVKDRYVYANAALARMFGYDKAEEMVGTPAPELYAPGEREGAVQLERGLLAGQAMLPFYEVKGLAQDGTVFEAAVWPAVIEYEGTPAILRFIIDARKEKALRARLLQAQKLKSIGTLAGGLAHDFNNLLGIMQGYTEMALHSCPADSPLRPRLQRVLKAGKRAKELVAQILAFSRPKQLDPQAVQVSVIVAETLKLLRAILPRTIELRQRLAAQRDSILADPGQIRQMLVNLCANAAQAMGQKGGVLEISLEEIDLEPAAAREHPDLPPGPYLKLAVSDTGPGMDPEVLERIFDPFFTTKAPGEGSGMGLSMVYGNVKAHGGAIAVHSEPGRGSVFQVLLPRGKEDFTEPQENLLPAGQGECILFVDDEKALASLWQEILESLGYEVVAKTSAPEALEVFRNHPDKFHLVIADQVMPHLTGMELAQKILNLRADIPVILYTGFSETISKKQAKAMGIREFLTKPLATRQVSEAIRKALGKAE
jgi:two-component system cell cycle sensor histidine kinase/response regulator CckA